MYLKSKLEGLFVIFLSFLAIQACATVKGQVSQQSFRQQNLPVRVINVVVASDGTHGRQEIDRLLLEASQAFDEQVGIRIHPVKYIPIAWGDRDVSSMLYTLKTTTDGDNFDMAIGFAGRAGLEYLTMNLVGTWDGAIDDTYRRYIVLKHLDKRTLLHELAHAFILSHPHSDSGLMMPMTFQLIPFIPIKLASSYLSPEDRRQVLEHKWRDFSNVANIDSREHPIAVTRAGPSTARYEGIMELESAFCPIRHGLPAC